MPNGLLDFLGDPVERANIRQGFMDAVNRGAVGAALGAPVDMANSLLNLGKAGYGYIGKKSGLLSTNQMPELIDNPVGGSEWFGKQMQNAGIVSDQRNQVAELLAGFLPTSPTTSAKAVAAIGAGGMVPGADAAMFIGSKAKTWDAAAAARALEMEKAGVPARSIWSETGTLRGPDGLLRQEIDDSGALFNTSTINGIKRENDLVDVGGNFDYGPINGFLDHDPLKAAYGTGLTNSTFIGNKNTLLGDGLHGSYDPHAGSITINAPAKAADARSTVLHELQHAIQQREGFAKGGFPGSFATQTFWSEPTLHNAKWAVNESRKTGIPVDEVVKQKNLGQAVLEAAQRPDLARLHEDAILAKAPFKSYQRLAGEAEARATEARMNMTPAERRATFPLDSYDVPINQLIIRNDGVGGMQMAIDRDAKSKLIRDLQAGSTDGPFRLGDVTPGQANALVNLTGAKLPSTADVMVTPEAFSHIYRGRVVRDGFTPAQVADVAEKALEKRARAVMDPASKNVHPALVNQGLLNSETGRRFDAVAPLRPTDQAFNLVTVVPDGLRAPKKKPRQTKD